MKKIGLLVLPFALIAVAFVDVPKAEACDVAMCEDITGCYGCNWYGVLFTNCFTGGCNTCATMRCEQNFLTTGEVTANASGESGPQGDACDQELDPKPEIQVLEVKVLPTRT